MGSFGFYLLGNMLRAGKFTRQSINYRYDWYITLQLFPYFQKVRSCDVFFLNAFPRVSELSYRSCLPKDFLCLRLLVHPGHDHRNWYLPLNIHPKKEVDFSKRKVTYRLIFHLISIDTTWPPPSYYMCGFKLTLTSMVGDKLMNP